jgi:ribosomal protein S14
MAFFNILMRNFNYLKLKRLFFSIKENKRIVYSFLNEIHESNLQNIRKFPSKISLRNQCLFTNKPISSFTEFRLSRHKFNDFSNQGILVGVRKAI